MFNSPPRGRDTGASAPLPTADGGKRGVFSVLAADVVVTGNISAETDLHIDGRVEGDVACGALVQGGDSVIVGGVAAENARLAGSIEGKVRVRQLQIERTARIAGDVEYEAITIENGARVEGHLRHKSPGTLAIGAATNVTPIGKPADAADQRLIS